MFSTSENTIDKLFPNEIRGFPFFIRKIDETSLIPLFVLKWGMIVLGYKTLREIDHGFKNVDMLRKLKPLQHLDRPKMLKYKDILGLRIKDLRFIINIYKKFKRKNFESKRKWFEKWELKVINHQILWAKELIDKMENEIEMLYFETDEELRTLIKKTHRAFLAKHGS